MTCPCCGKPRSIEPHLPPLSRELDTPDDRPASTHPGWTVRAARDERLQWACQRCLQSGRALSASPRLQTFLDYPPYLAYYDLEHRCSDCSNSFIFGRFEQRYWYETLKFWVQSVPKQCPACRRRRRRKIATSKRLQGLLASSDQDNPHHLVAIATAYFDNGSVAKAGRYLRRARNLALRRNDRDLLGRIAKLAEGSEQT